MGVLLALALSFPGCLAAGPAAKSRKPEPYALIAGSVFRDSGFSLPGAELTVEAVPGDSKPSKFKRIRVVSDARGEFAVRVPAAPMRYNVSARANGYRPETKDIAIQGEERVELYFRLESESK